ncbi:hypothetical protein ACYX78_00180 [Advenella incenata]
MTEIVNRFFNRIENAAELSQSAQVELFVYFLTMEMGNETVTPQQVVDCFIACDLAAPKNVAARLSEGLKAKPPKFIKSNGGYKLHRHRRVTLSSQLGAEKIILETCATLRGLENKVPDGPAKEFLKETVICFESGANRATIVMAWILAMDNMYSYILANKLNEFNAAVAQAKGMRISAVVQRDDFTEMKEVKFIELCRAAKIISNSVGKVLNQKLDIRNSSAHPSGVVVSRSKVIDFVEDLVQNVLLKYPV